MNRLDQLLTVYVNVPYDELVSSAKGCLQRLAPYFERIKADFLDEYLLVFMATAMAVDGTFTPLEYRFFCDLTGCNRSYDEVLAVIATYHNAQSVALVDAVFSSIPSNDVRKDLLDLFLCVCACDEEIAANETKMFLTLLDN